MLKIMLAAAVTLSLFSASAYASGEGFYLGGLQFKPAFELTGINDSNITFAESMPIYSYITVAKPSLDVVAGGEVNYMNLNYAFERGIYRDSKGDSYSDHLINFGSHREFTHRAKLETAMSYKKSHDARGTTYTGLSTGFTTPDLWNENAANLKFTYGGDHATGRIVMQGGYALRRYDNHRSLTLGRDLDTFEFGAAFYYRLGARTAALFELKDKVLDYRWAQSTLDSNELTFFTGVAWKPSSITSATIKLGWQRKRFKASYYPISQYFSWDASAEWAPLTYSVWKLNTGYAAKEIDGSGGIFIKSQNIAFTWKHYWLARLSHLAELQYQHDAFIGLLRKDKDLSAGISINYSFRPGLDIVAAYSYSERTSNVFNSSYRQNMTKISLEKRL
ncbi:MAG: hypothetical protein CO186_05570 [Zetaproteobacteria bacterium CG_4_9_14_3_um_filter_49_83]|nr:MAG: hypothetical protein COW62_04135 [Zetaproteobacteria bacterium CG17_big_fil_post_rev_8_21_14_2_50_50_13]PIV29511.1 MAG: hypothetical protein COS35_11745 [Zetaproteobacteria bacterium CG02_land_8_20_14_3_00_50_9]PIY55574.1 MAG: hypothetical protein COZ00_08640 [Zetaproteobacteria bacterium CG_4_10_14_0_8_um_filter_49_80]PJA35466.1 MAG: hypothetical protein CO186_05570 [Zetaproteobacteria bacterium CG_4_9_14_3_um_filter_49_83]